MDNFTEIERLKKKGIIGEKTSQIYLGKQGVSSAYVKTSKTKPKVNYLRRRVFTFILLSGALIALVVYINQ
jgi:hypothetical protein